MKHEMAADARLAWLSATLSVAFLATLLATSLAGAQGDPDAACCAGESGFEARYSIRSIVRLTSTSQGTGTVEDLWYGDGTDSRLGVLSMNSHGEVVGTMHAQVELADGMLAWMPHPFVWLPAPAYGLGSGLHDLMEGEPIAGYALDISDTGIIVGGAGEAFQPPDTGFGPRASLWDLRDSLASGTIAPPTRIDGTGEVAGDTSGWSVATAVEGTHESDAWPRIVGAWAPRCPNESLESSRTESVEFVRVSDGHWDMHNLAVGELDALPEENVYFSVDEWSVDIAGPGFHPIGHVSTPHDTEGSCIPGLGVENCGLPFVAGLHLAGTVAESWTLRTELTGDPQHEATSVRSSTGSSDVDSVVSGLYWEYEASGGTSLVSPCVRKPMLWRCCGLRRLVHVGACGAVLLQV